MSHYNIASAFHSLNNFPEAMKYVYVDLSFACVCVVFCTSPHVMRGMILPPVTSPTPTLNLICFCLYPNKLRPSPPASPHASTKLAIFVLHANAHSLTALCAKRRYFKKAIELKPDYADAHFNLGICYQDEVRVF